MTEPFDLRRLLVDAIPAVVVAAVVSIVMANQILSLIHI